MAFGIGVNSQSADAGPIRGTLRDIACACWFTSKGNITPLMIKLQDEDGEIQTIRQIQVYSQEKKNYAGTPSIEFDCSIELQQRQVRVWLIYYVHENRWVLNFR